MNERIKHWTKKELSLRPGPVQLAMAVIEQWKADGSPKCDTEAISYWVKVVETWQKDHDDKIHNTGTKV